MRDYQVVEKVVEKVIYVDRPLEKVPGRPLRQRHALLLFILVAGHACHSAATGMPQITQTRTSARAREHVHRVGKQTCFVPPLADPRDVSFPGAPGQVEGGVGGIALGDEVRVFPWRARGRNASSRVRGILRVSAAHEPAHSTFSPGN